MYSDADTAALHAVMDPRDPDGSPADRFYHQLVTVVSSVLDGGCWTGAIFSHAWRLSWGSHDGLGSDDAILDQTRRHSGIEWAVAPPVDTRWQVESP